MKVPPVSEKILKVTLSDLNSYSFGNSCLNNSQCYENFFYTYWTILGTETEYVIIDKIQLGIMHEKFYKHPV